MADDGKITFSTALDNSSLEKGLKETERQIDDLKKKIEEKTTEKNALAEELQEAAMKADEAAKSVDNLKLQLAELKATQPTESLTMGELQSQIEAVSQELDTQTEAYSNQLDAAYGIAQRYNEADEQLKRYTSDLDVAEKRQQKLGASLKETYAKGGAALEAPLRRLDASMTTITGKVQKRLKKLFAFSFIFAALSSLKSYLVSAIGENERFASSVEMLKAVLRGFGVPIVAALTPLFVGFVRVVTTMFLTLARLIDTVFRTNIVGSIQESIAAARASNAAAQATDNQAKATKRLAKAQKEASKWLAAFDELNVMQAQDNQEIADDMDGGGIAEDLGDAGEGMTVDWDAFDAAAQIDEKLAEIMIILGAALLAVGAILAFSGINIPLGITLMAIGALMIYTAVSEQWAYLPEEVNKTIVRMLEIVGGALIVIGVILCLTGNVPLGIGFIIAGAALFATAIALDWEALSNNVNGALNDLLNIVAGFIAVIGVVLIVFGHPILGIAAIIAGIAIFALSANNEGENGAALPEKVKGVLDVLLGIISGALIVIGVVLCVMQAYPVGVALILAGVGVFIAREFAIDTEKLPTTVEGVFLKIMDILWRMLIVIGIVLCCFGVFPLGIAAIVAGIGVLALQTVMSGEDLFSKVQGEIEKVFTLIRENAPYVLALGLILCAFGLFVPGIACVVAGIWSIVSPETFNFDFLLEKIKEVWNGIVDWFKSTVAPIFTVEWWSDKFKAIVNGLIGILNSGLGAADWFVSSMLGGLSDIAASVGINLGYQHVQPQFIPYLAQGAVIPPNRRFMAVLGDQANGTNLEAPESLIRQIVREETGGANAQMVALMQQMVELMQGGQTLECDGYTLAKVVNDRNRINSRLYGV